MIPFEESFSIVINGAWNPSIFQENWILKNLIENENETIVTYYPTDQTAPRKIKFAGLSLYPGRRQLKISPIEPTLEGMINAAKVVTKILTVLVHTPIINCGINYALQETEEIDKISSQLVLGDEAKINSQIYDLKFTNISRKYFIEAGKLLSVGIGLIGDNEIRAEFNYHYENTDNDINYYIELFSNDEIESKYNETIAFIKNVYDLDIEEVED